MKNELVDLLYNYIDTNTVIEQRKQYANITNYLSRLEYINHADIYKGLDYAIKKSKLKKYLTLLYDSKLIEELVEGYTALCKARKDNRIFQNGYAMSIINTAETMNLSYGNEPEMVLFLLYRPQIKEFYGEKDLGAYYKTTQKEAVFLKLSKNVQKTKLDYDKRLKVEKYFKLALIDLPVLYNTEAVEDYTKSCMELFNNNREELLHYLERYLYSNELFYTHKNVNGNKNNGNYYNTKLFKDIKDILLKDKHVLVDNTLVIPKSIINYIKSKTNESATVLIVNELRKLGVLDKNKIDSMIDNALVGS